MALLQGLRNDESLSLDSAKPARAEPMAEKLRRSSIRRLALASGEVPPWPCMREVGAAEKEQDFMRALCRCRGGHACDAAFGMASLPPRPRPGSAPAPPLRQSFWALCPGPRRPAGIGTARTEPATPHEPRPKFGERVVGVVDSLCTSQR